MIVADYKGVGAYRDDNGKVLHNVGFHVLINRISPMFCHASGKPSRGSLKNNSTKNTPQLPEFQLLTEPQLSWLTALNPQPSRMEGLQSHSQSLAQER